ncbi:CBS domain-containing protein [Psychroserpens luteus]|uniref:HPP family protein n=1 Tax=Psychroserpens luteus TaxID=1434066 RepID=A0ABW5ZS69_9FLAO|nr:CBS domain-containing protein [Psychroserpens luteus]
MKSTPISSIMTKNVVCVSPEQKIIDVKHIYEKENFHHHILVTKNDKLMGIVSLIDFMYRIKGAGLDDNNSIYNDLLVKDIMTTNPFSLSPSATIQKVALELSKGKFRAIPIVEDEKVVGIVSTEDLIKYFLEKQ